MSMHASIRAEAGVTRLEIVKSPDRLAAIGAQWMQLWQECDGLIFQSHEWICAWVKTASRPERIALRIGLAWNGDRLIAVVPLAVTRRKGLRFLEWAAVAHSDYGDVLCAPECSDATLDAIWAVISEAGGYDIAFINRLLPDAAARRVFAPGRTVGTRLHPGHRREISTRIACNWESGAAWLAGRSKKARKNYRRGVRLLEEAGTMRFRLLGPDEPLDAVIARVAALKRKWLEATGRSSDLFDEGTATLKALVSVLARTGILRIFTIEIDGAMAAVSINFVQRNTMMDWVKTYDPDFARASPGLVLIFEYMQWAVDHGLHTVDLLCGSEAFKERFASHTVALETLVGARSLKGSLALALDAVRRKFRQRREQEAAPDEEPD